MNVEKEKRIKELIERSKRTRGYPAWEYLIRKDPDMFEVYQKLYEKALMPGKHLPVKTKELIAIALLAFRGKRDAVINHVRRAKQFGATKEEIYEAAITSIIPGGAPTFGVILDAVRVLEEDEEKEKENEDN